MISHQTFLPAAYCALCLILMLLCAPVMSQNLTAVPKRMDTFQVNEFIKNSRTPPAFSNVTIVPRFNTGTGTFETSINVPTELAELYFYKCNFEGIDILVQNGSTHLSIRSSVGIRRIRGGNGLDLELYGGTEVDRITVDAGKTMIVGEKSIVNSVTVTHSILNGIYFKEMDVHGVYISNSVFFIDYMASGVDAKGPWAFGKLDISNRGDTVPNPKYWILAIKAFPINYHYFSIRLEGSTIEDLLFDNCRFEKVDSFGTKAEPGDFLVLPILNCRLAKASFLNSQLPDVDFYGTSIEKSLSMVGSTVDRLGCLFLDLPANNVNGLPFEKIKGEKIFLCERILGNLKTYPADSLRSPLVVKNRDGGYNSIPYVKIRPYFAATQEDLRDSTLYEELINVHSKFLKLYRDRGDIVSANACYIEIKRIEGKRLKLQYEHKPTLQNYFGYALNRFLSAFSDYGTNPVKSMIYAFYVMLIFSGFYCIFPSEPDNLMTFRVYSFFSSALEYFKTNKQLTEFHRESRKHDIEALERFATAIRDSKRNIPAIVWWLGTPLYKMAIGYNKTVVWLLGKTDIVKGRWEDINKGKRFRLSIIVGLFFVCFLLVGLLMRIVNAIVLSLNAFITLGYGEISAKGVARYLAVVEGVFGWFLLSIFSVSLISQILN
jgi:hypothetical protein